jgi:hypothetical protein
MMDVPTRLRHGLIGPQAKRPSTSRLGTTLSGCLVKTKIQGESNPEAYPRGYVEDFDEPRTMLADFFSILPTSCFMPKLIQASSVRSQSKLVVRPGVACYAPPP